MDKREVQALQFLADLNHRCQVTTQAQNVTAQAMQHADVFFLERTTEYVAFKLLDLVMYRFTDRLVVLGDEVEQGVQHEVFAMFEQKGARFAA
ncbi:hypothetical protein D3C76_797290 [compost metagenome]